jgi:hypothetical protein
MSGGYDLLVFVGGASLQRVAAFVSENFDGRRRAVDGHAFMLRSLREQGFLMDEG